jgi:hypothetical protein
MTLIKSISSDMKRNLFTIRSAILMLLMWFSSGSIIAQKVNPDTLNPEQLNLYMDKAVKMNTAGIVLTAGGIGIVATGLGLLTSYALRIPYDEWDDSVTNLYAFITLGGTASVIAGATLWAIGGSKKAKAELALKNLTVSPEGSMAVGLGLTIRF